MRSLVLLACSLLFCSPVFPQDVPSDFDPDFVLSMTKCESLGVSLRELYDDFLRAEAIEQMNVCMRRGKVIQCLIEFPSEEGPAETKFVTYDVILDSPPLLFFGNEAGSDWIGVNTVAHTAVTITRVVETTFAASKTCRGIFVTTDELEKLDR